MDELKSQELKQQKDLDRKNEWDDILFQDMSSVIEIDNTVEISDSAYMSPGSKFELKMTLKHISFEGEYLTGESVVDLTCEVCGHVWEEAGCRVLRRGCPACFEIDRNIFKARAIWIRSKQIISDKGGVIVKIPEQTLEHVTCLDDVFGLKCGDGNHIFTFSHKKLRDNQWCPICAHGTARKTVRTSKHTYHKKFDDTKKYDRLVEIAQLKQMSLDSKKYKERMNFTCSKCGDTTILSGRQLCENKYPCRNRCVTTHKIKM